LRFEHRSSKWGVEIFGDNLTNEGWYEHSFEPIQPGLAPTVISAPRIVGATLRVAVDGA